MEKKEVHGLKAGHSGHSGCPTPLAGGHGWSPSHTTRSLGSFKQPWQLFPDASILGTNLLGKEWQRQELGLRHFSKGRRVGQDSGRGWWPSAHLSHINGLSGESG